MKFEGPNEYMGQQKKKGRFFWHVRPVQLMKPILF
jgi:hypothetical protein